MSTRPNVLCHRACEEFDGLVRGVGPDQWDAPTPCTDWNVRNLVNHVAVEHLWVPPMLAGRTITDVGSANDGDRLGDDPVAACAEALATAADAVTEPDVESRTVHLPYGDESGAEYLRQVFADCLIHGWDLAVAIGADSRLPADLVEACATWFAHRRPVFADLGLLGGIADEVPTAPGADAQTRLLAAFGRDAATPITPTNQHPSHGKN